VFFHLHLRAKETYRYNGLDFEIAVYRAQEDGHYRGYISAGGFSDLVAEISGETALNFLETSDVDPTQQLIGLIKSEIDAGKFDT